MNNSGILASSLLPAVLFKLVLDLSYIYFVVPFYEYYGLGLDFDLSRYAVSWIFAVLLYWVSPKMLDRPSKFYISFFLYALIFPVLSYWALSGRSSMHLGHILLFFLLVVFLTKIIKFRKPVVFKNGVFAFYGITFVLIFIVTAWLVYSSGGRFNLNFTKVYEFREFTESEIYVFPWGYLVNMASKGAAPALMGLALYRKNYKLVALLIGLHVIWFSITSHKAILFYPILLMVTWFFLSRSFSARLFPAIFTLVILGSLAMYYAGFGMIYPAMFVVRMFFIVAMNTFDYYSFFSSNDFVFWSNSVLSWALEYPYLTNPSDMLGEIRGTGAHVNNSFVSTAYMHAGVFGVFLYATIFSVMIKFLDAFPNNSKQMIMVVLMTFIPMRTLILSTDLFTALLTHGLFLAMLLVMLGYDAIRKQGV